MHIYLYAGSEKMYKVTNTKKFIADYYEEKDIRLGKQFYFIPGECAFDEASANVMSYLTEIYEIQETLGKTYYSNLFSRQEMVLSQNMLVKLLHLAKGLECQLSLFGKDAGTAQIVEGRPEISLDMKMDEEGLTLAQEGEDKLYALSEDGSILYYRKDIYLPERDYICNLLPFYSSLFRSQEGQIDFRGRKQKAFYREGFAGH